MSDAMKTEFLQSGQSPAGLPFLGSGSETGAGGAGRGR